MSLEYVIILVGEGTQTETSPNESPLHEWLLSSFEFYKHFSSRTLKLTS